MCGIAGIVDLSGKPIDPAVVRQMCGAMARRGPDAESVIELPGAVLGHRRLAILDLSSKGDQPMSAEDRALWVVHNGEIYNHGELKKELGAKGFSYRSGTDTESLLHGYSAWKQDLSRRCRGMWAFGLWDSGEKSLYMSRDRLGEKPLYYQIAGPRIIFASNLAAMMAALGRGEIDPQAVASLLAYEYVPHDECILKGVRKLPPAHYLVFSKAGVSLTRYWDLDYHNKLDITLEEAVREIDGIVDAAVLEQLVADVPVGVFLSGGVDSGYVAALASKHKPGISAITMTVPGCPARDESENARRVVAKHALRSVEVPLDEECIRDLPALLAGIEPLGDSSLIPAAAVSREAARHLKVVLTGDGGDEGFGGYGVPQTANRAQRKRRGVEGWFWRGAAPILKYLSYQRTRSLARLLRLHASGAELMAGAGIEGFLRSREATPMQVRRLIYGPALRGLCGRPLGRHLIAALERSRHTQWWEATLNIGLTTRLADDFLIKVDTATMFSSLESRAPLLDHRLHEFLARLPFEVLMPGEEYKGLLKMAAARHNPREVVYSSKKGFSIPVERYFLGGWGRLLVDLTRDGVASQMGLIDPRGLEKYLGKHGLRASFRLDRQLFTILALEIWLRVTYEKCDTAVELGERLVASIRKRGKTGNRKGAS